MNETRTLAEFVARLRYEDLLQAVVDQACRIVVDTVGCALSAWSEDPEKSRIASFPPPRIERIASIPDCPLNIADCDGAPARVLARAVAD